MVGKQGDDAHTRSSCDPMFRRIRNWAALIFFVGVHEY